LPSKELNMTKKSQLPIYYGLIIAVVGTFGVLLSFPGQTVGVSTFTDPLIIALGLTRDQISLAYGLGTIGSSLFLGIAGKWFDKYGARRVATAATLLLSLALFVSSKSAWLSNNINDGLQINSWLTSFVIIMFCFFIIRFSGQGVLTLASRNMIMLWFDKYRGRINAFSSVAVSLGFSISPPWINFLIDDFGWEGAWYWMAAGLLVFAGVVFATFRDLPEKYGLVPDGNLGGKVKQTSTKTGERNYTRSEAIKTRAFWIYSLMLSFNAYFVTGLTFHIVSIFGKAGYSKEEALTFFFPMSVISFVTSVIFNMLSDKTKLKNILYVMIFGAIISSVGLGLLSINAGFYILIAGVGLMQGLYAVLSSVAWPRFFGRKHLGAISGLNMQMIVFSSALGPFLFSLSNTLFDSYAQIGFAGLIGLVLIAIGAIKADNPQ